MYDLVDPPEYRVGERVLAVPWDAPNPYETTVYAIRVTTHGEPKWLYEVGEHPLRTDREGLGLRAALFGRQLRPVPAVVQLADLVTE